MQALSLGESTPGAWVIEVTIVERSEEEKRGLVQCPATGQRKKHLLFCYLGGWMLETGVAITNAEPTRHFFF